MDTAIVKEVDGPNTNGWYTISFEEGFSHKEATTKNEELAKTAFQSRGSEVPVAVSERVNGRFTNVYLNEIDGVKDAPKRGGARKSGTSAATSAPAPKDQKTIGNQWAFGRAVELLTNSGMEYAFPLDDTVKAQLVDAATWLISARDSL